MEVALRYGAGARMGERVRAIYSVRYDAVVVSMWQESLISCDKRIKRELSEMLCICCMAIQCVRPHDSDLGRTHR